MNIVNISGGLGHQMFQYAFYLAMKAIDSDTGIDILSFMYHNYHNCYELGNVFQVKPDVLTPDVVKRYADVSHDLLSVIRRDWLHINRKVDGNLYVEDSPLYDSHVFELRNTYFQGSWQSWRYFDKVRDTVLTQFQFKNAPSQINAAVIDAMKGSESVALHVRRGDYTKKRRWNQLGSICSLDYYGWAMANIRQQLGENVHYFVFSDDMPWVRKNLSIPNATYIDWNSGAESYNDMRLMSLCKHNIIANSSFSWWAAYLNENPDKIVIAPNKWYRNLPTPDLLPPFWTQVAID